MTSEKLLEKNDNNGDLQWNSFRDYLAGYKALILLTLEDIKEIKNIIFPLSFLVAHFIELEIKYLNLIWGSSPNEGYTIKSLGLNRNHSLQKLIEDSVEEWHHADVTKIEITKLKKLVKYFEDFSTTKSLSESMRYPVDVNGKIIVDLKRIKFTINSSIEEYFKNIKTLINLFEIIEIKHILYNASLLRVSLNYIKERDHSFDQKINELDEMCMVYNSLIKIKMELINDWFVHLDK